MCNFFSSICTVDEQFLYLEFSDSHEDIIDFYRLKDNGKAFVRGEFKPENICDFADIEKYNFFLDEQSAPSWFTDEVKDRWADKCKRLLSNRIYFSGKHSLLIDGFYILAGSVIIKKVKNCRIQSICDNAQVESICDNAQVKSICDNARILNDERKK